jgi:hypothetical protein
MHAGEPYKNMSEADEYRANAENCRRMADRASNEHDKRAWLEMAQSWSFLTKLEDAPSKGFDAEEYDDDADRSDVEYQLTPIILEIKKQCARIAVAFDKAAKAVGVRLDRVGIARTGKATASKPDITVAAASRPPQPDSESKPLRPHSEHWNQPPAGLPRDRRAPFRS